MTKAIIAAAVAAAIAVVPALLAAPAAHANPACEGFTIPGFTESCERLDASCHETARVVGEAAYQDCEQRLQQIVQQARVDEQQRRQQRQRQTAPSNPPTQPSPTVPGQAPSNPATQVPATTPVPVSAPPSATVAPPKGLDASPQDIAAAKAAPATQVDPANPPTPPTHADFNQQTQSVIESHHAHLDVVNGLAHPRHWDYIDYDQNQHPILYNPIHQAMTFRYFYGGAYQEVYVAAASRVVLNVAVPGVFPFTAVGGNYLTSGSFYGGSPPPLYQNVAAYIPAYNHTVQVGKVQQVGHDDSQPAGSQDTFMLDDSTLAWGQANNPTDGGQITVTKTQTLPGVGPTDDGKSLVDLAVASHPQSDGMIGRLVLIGLVAGLGVLGALGIGGVWIWKRRTETTA